ncbi:MAG: SDR family oxidoreductase [Proteobacteria bacterium]|nr:SDR family oxidoreductase [Pseudomonadota bacterium]MCZ6783274.1 SDR family oxidoreductase [Pseudomonadota bacterium]
MSVTNFSLEGKVAIVTGGSRGIGRSIAIGLAEHGADVAIAARKPEALAEAVGAVEATGRRAIAVPTNVRRMDELRSLVDETRSRLGRVDILVNNAGTNPVYGPVQDIDERAWDNIMNTNVKAAHFLSNHAREAMLEHGEGGSIVNVSSVGGYRASDVIGGYSVSKAALIMLTQVQAKTWGADGIRVNCIAPGLIKTEFARALWEDERTLRGAVADAALRRIGEPDEMAGAVVYLAGPSASFVTGQTLVLDGGRLV